MKLGFKNYADMSLTLNEQTTENVLKLFDELDELTKKPYEAAKAEIDVKLAAKVGKKPADLMPWDYQDPFFQESPSVFDANLDDTYQSVNIRALCREFYAGIGLPIEDVLARSDLFREAGQKPARVL